MVTLSKQRSVLVVELSFIVPFRNDFTFSFFEPQLHMNEDLIIQMDVL